MAKILDWTQELIDHLVLSWKKGLSAREISNTIPGSTRHSIIGKLNRLGRVGDGSRTPGTNQYSTARTKPKKFNPKTFAPPESTRSVAKEAERLSLAVPPPPLPVVSDWKGMVGAVDAIQDGECRWPLPDGMEKPTAFCGAPVEPKHHSYCPYHYDKAFKND